MKFVQIDETFIYRFCQNFAVPCAVSLSSLARTLGSWVRIPFKAWMFRVCMRLFCLCVVLCLGIRLATG
jgi:hypothetical protein